MKMPASIQHRFAIARKMRAANRLLDLKYVNQDHKTTHLQEALHCIRMVVETGEKNEEVLRDYRISLGTDAAALEEEAVAFETKQNLSLNDADHIRYKRSALILECRTLAHFLVITLLNYIVDPNDEVREIFEKYSQSLSKTHFKLSEIL